MVKYYALKFKDDFVCVDFSEKYEDFWLSLEELDIWNTSTILHTDLEDVIELIEDIKHWFTAEYNHKYECSFTEELMEDEFRSLRVVEIELDLNYKEIKI